MKRPNPVKNGECEQCLNDKPLLMPVSFVPGWPIVVWQLLCFDCRIGLTSDRYAEMGETWKFSRRQTQRDAYDEWLEVESL